MGPKKLYRSETNKMICGVSGGLADYFALDPSIVRLLFVLFGCTGTGIVAYVVASIIIPTESTVV